MSEEHDGLYPFVQRWTRCELLIQLTGPISRPIRPTDKLTSRPERPTYPADRPDTTDRQTRRDRPTDRSTQPTDVTDRRTDPTDRPTRPTDRPGYI